MHAILVTPHGTSFRVGVELVRCKGCVPEARYYSVGILA